MNSGTGGFMVDAQKIDDLVPCEGMPVEHLADKIVDFGIY